MKHSALILAHKNPSQIKRLADSLSDSSIDLFVHVDKKVEIAPFKSELDELDNVRFLADTERVDVTLNDFSLVDATVNLMKAARRRGEKGYQILLTGQDYPIKPVARIIRALDASYPLAYIDSYSVYAGRDHGVKWVEHVGHNYFSQYVRRRLMKLLGNKLYYSKGG